MVQPQTLKGRLECMMQVETQKEKGDDIKHHISPETEQLLHQQAHILHMFAMDLHLRQGAKLGFDEEVGHVNDQENEDDSPRMDHEFGEDGGVGIALYPVPYRSCYPVLNLQDQTIYYVNDETGKQDPLEGLNEGIGAHEMRGCIKQHAAGIKEQQEVDAEVYHQEGDQKQARQGHDEFLGQRG